MKRVVLCVALAACRSPEESPTATATASTTATASATVAPSASVSGPVPCPAPTLLVDGAPMKVASALAVQIAGGPYQLTFSTRALTCSELLTGAVAVKRDEISFNVGYGKEAIQRRVDFRNESAKPAVELVTAPSKPGDEIAVCVRDRVHLSGKLPMSDDPARAIDVQGLVGAKLCGGLK